MRWAIVLVSALLLYFLPIPGLKPSQRHLLAIFAATIISLVAQPVPMGVSVVVARTALALTGALSAAKALSGFSNATVWLVFTAFLFARAITATGFGLRIAYLFIRRLFRPIPRAEAESSTLSRAAWRRLLIRNRVRRPDESVRS